MTIGSRPVLPIRALSCGDAAPLMERLSNEIFRTELDRLYNKSLTVSKSKPDVTSSAEKAACRCGCGEVVTPPRQFVNQSHQVIWLRTQRYLGKNLGR
jgi:hypothetical protein